MCLLRAEYKPLNSKQVNFNLPRSPAFDPGPVDVRFVMDTLELKRGFLRIASHVSVIPPVLHAYSSSSMYYAYHKDNRAKPGNLKKSLLFRVSGSTRQRSALMLFYLSASPLSISCTSDPLSPFCLKIVWAMQEQLVEYVFLSSKCNVELQMLEAQDKTRTSKATSDMLRHKWLHPVQQPGPTQRLIQVCYVTPSARNALLGY